MQACLSTVKVYKRFHNSGSVLKLMQACLSARNDPKRRFNRGGVFRNLVQTLRNRMWARPPTQSRGYEGQGTPRSANIQDRVSRLGTYVENETQPAVSSLREVDQPMFVDNSKDPSHEVARLSQVRGGVPSFKSADYSQSKLVSTVGKTSRPSMMGRAARYARSSPYTRLSPSTVGKAAKYAPS